MALNKETLKKEIQEAIEDVLPGALQQGLISIQPRNTEVGQEAAEKFAKTITELLAEPLATALAAAIDYHVRSAEIYGTINTIGGPSSQMATIVSPTPLTNGKTPNSLGIK